MSIIRDDKTSLYFIALIPPAPVFEQASKLKEYFKETYKSKAALSSPPHITLHMPFRWKKEKEEKLITALGEHIKRYDPLKVCLDNFGVFEPRVVFINVVNSEALSMLQKGIERFCRRELNLLNANYRDLPFHPHLTLAFRDLKKDEFALAWNEFKTKEFKAEFIADRLALLRHDGERWEVLKEFTLESSYSTGNQKILDTTEG